MPHRRTFLLALAAPLAGSALTRAAAAFQMAPPSPLPPLSWSCPMHPEVVDNAAGKCPICGMTLEQLRLALVWTCPVHTDTTAAQPGQCRRCGRDLIRVTKALSFTCPVHPTVSVLDPGRCPRCRRTLVARYMVRPHGDHNPKHGGSFFMVSNNWHLEVTHPAASVFRLYVYDNYSKPFAPPGLTARITEVLDVTGKRTQVTVPFARSARGYYEARVPNLAVPATIAAKVRFEAADKEYHFDFIFPDYSKEPSIRPRR
jgi:predicted RNA-binding Zn-ribbon protein involved in translation (DUF1610 family)